MHPVPPDIKQVLTADPKALSVWQGLTPLARNEWICWVTFFKKEATRKAHLKRLIVDLKHGHRRPCCWIGCIHRSDKPISPSVRSILKIKNKV